MKTNFLITIIAGLVTVTVCCKSKAQKDAEDYMNKIGKTVKENTPSNSEQNFLSATDVFRGGTVPSSLTLSIQNQQLKNSLLSPL